MRSMLIFASSNSLGKSSCSVIMAIHVLWQTTWSDDLIERLGAVDGATLWPPKSPDLTPMDFYLWRILEGMVHAHPIKNSAQLEDRIIEAFDTVKQQHGTTRRTVHTILDRFHAVLQNEGRHLAHFWWWLNNFEYITVNRQWPIRIFIG